MLYSCTHMTTVGVKGLMKSWSVTRQVVRRVVSVCCWCWLWRWYTIDDDDDRWRWWQWWQMTVCGSEERNPMKWNRCISRTLRCWLFMASTCTQQRSQVSSCTSCDLNSWLYDYFLHCWPFDELITGFFGCVMVFVSNYVNSCMKFLLNIHEMAALNVSDNYVTNLIQRAACHAVECCCTSTELFNSQTSEVHF